MNTTLNVCWIVLRLSCVQREHCVCANATLPSDFLIQPIQRSVVGLRFIAGLHSKYFILLGMMVLCDTVLHSIVIVAFVARNEFKWQIIGNGLPLLRREGLIACLHIDKVSSHARDACISIREFQHDTIIHIAGVDRGKSIVALSQPELVAILAFERIFAAEVKRVFRKV